MNSLLRHGCLPKATFWGSGVHRTNSDFGSHNVGEGLWHLMGGRYVLGGLINIPKFTGQPQKIKCFLSSWWPKAVGGLNQHLRGEAVLDALDLLCGCENMRCAVGEWGRLSHNHSVSSLPRSRGCRPLGSPGPLPCHWLTHRSLRGWKRMWVGTEWSSDNVQGQA